MKFPQTTQRRWLLGLVCLWLTAGWGAVGNESGSASEYEVKATYLYNFIRFTYWPSDAFPTAKSPIVIGIVGEDPFGKALDEAVSGATVRNHPFVVKRLPNAEDLSSCHVLFISRSESVHFHRLLSQIKGQPILTTSDVNDFAEQGGMVNLLIENQTVKLEINQAVVEAEGIQISAKLLNLARIVKSK